MTSPSRLRALLRQFGQTRRDLGMAVACRMAAYFVLRRMIGRDHGAVGLRRHGRRGSGCTGYLTGVWTDLARRDAFCAPEPGHRRRPRIALIGDLNLPQCRKYRVEQAGAFWRAQGAALDFAHFEDVPRAVALLQQATHLMLYRLTAGPQVSMYLYEARRLGLPVLYDIDDPLFSVPAYATYGNMAALDDAARAHFMAEAPGYLDVMNASDAISVSTPALARHAAGFTRRPVFLRRNYADPGTLAFRPPERGTSGVTFRLAFASGSRGHEADFARIAGPVTSFLRADPARRLMILGHFNKSRLPAAVRGQVEWHRFTDYAGYLARLAQADCAVLPLGNDLFNRCKSGVRALDAFAAGCPVITDPVGDAVSVVEDGETGFVAADLDGWQRALEGLASTPDRARAMGRTARARLEERWTVSGPAPAHVADPELIRWVTA